MFKNILNGYTRSAVVALLVAAGSFVSSFTAQAKEVHPEIRSSLTPIVQVAQRASQILENQVKADGGSIIEQNAGGLENVNPGVRSPQMTPPPPGSSASFDEPLPDPRTEVRTDTRTTGERVNDSVQSAANDVYQAGRDADQGLRNVLGDGLGGTLGAATQLGTSIGGGATQAAGYVAEGATDAGIYVYDNVLEPTGNAVGNFFTNTVPNAVDSIIPTREGIASFFGFGSRPAQQQVADAPTPQEQPTVAETSAPAPEVAVQPTAENTEPEAVADTRTPGERANDAVQAAAGDVYQAGRDADQYLRDNLGDGLGGIAGAATQLGTSIGGGATQLAGYAAEGATDAGVYVYNNVLEPVGNAINTIIPTREEVNNFFGVGERPAQEQVADAPTPQQEQPTVAETSVPPRAMTASEQGITSENMPSNAEAVYLQEFNRTDNVQVAENTPLERSLGTRISDTTTQIVGGIAGAIDSIIPTREQVSNLFNFGSRPAQEQVADAPAPQQEQPTVAETSAPAPESAAQPTAENTEPQAVADTRTPGERVNEDVQAAAGDVYQAGRDADRYLRDNLGEGLGGIAGGVTQVGTGVAGLTTQAAGYVAEGATDAGNYVYNNVLEPVGNTIGDTVTRVINGIRVTFGPKEQAQQQQVADVPAPQEQQTVAEAPAPAPEAVAPAPEETVAQPVAENTEPERPLSTRIAEGTGRVVEGTVNAISDAAVATGGAIGDAANFVGGLASDAYNGVAGLFKSSEKPEVKNVTISIDKRNQPQEQVADTPAPRALTAEEQGLVNSTEAFYIREMSRTDDIPTAKPEEKSLGVKIAEGTGRVVEGTVNAISDAAVATGDAIGTAATATGNFFTKDIPEAVDKIIPTKEQVANLFGMGKKEPQLTEDQKIREDMLAQGYSDEDIENALMRAEMYKEEMAEQTPVENSPTVNEITNGYPENKENFGETFAQTDKTTGDQVNETVQRAADDVYQAGHNADRYLRDNLGEGLGGAVGSVTELGTSIGGGTTQVAGYVAGGVTDASVAVYDNVLEPVGGAVGDFVVNTVPNAVSRTVDAVIPSKESLAKLDVLNVFGSKEKPAQEQVAEIPQEPQKPVSELEKFLTDKGLSAADIQTALTLANGGTINEPQKAVKGNSSLKNTLASAQKSIKDEVNQYTLTGDKDTSNIVLTVNGMGSR